MNQNTESREYHIETAYAKIIEELTALHKTFEQPHLRKFIELRDNPALTHQFISPVIDITLSDDKQLIFYGIPHDATYWLGAKPFTELTRIIYRATAKENTPIDIEDCLDQSLYHYGEYKKAFNNPEAKINLEYRQ